MQKDSTLAEPHKVVALPLKVVVVLNVTVFIIKWKLIFIASLNTFIREIMVVIDIIFFSVKLLAAQPVIALHIS